LLEVGQVQVLEDEAGDLIDLDVNLEVLGPRLVARAVTLAGALAPLTLAAEDVADFRGSVALRDVLLLAIVVAELVLLERADRHLDAPFAIREDDRLVRDDRAEVLLDRLADTLLVPLLVDLPLALEAPVVALNTHNSQGAGGRGSGAG